FETSSGAAPTAVKRMAPTTASAVICSAGGTTGPPGGVTLPPLQNAASAARPAGVPKPDDSAAFSPSRRLSSLGFLAHFSAASKADLDFAAGLAPSASRRHKHAHHTASRLGRPLASTRTASGYKLFSVKISKYRWGDWSPVRCRAACSLSIKRSQISAA